MNEYMIRTRVEYVLVLEVESEGKALEEACDTDFHDWEEFCSGEYNVELIGKVASETTQQRATDAISAIQVVVDYLWEDELQHYKAGRDGPHIFQHLVAIRSWLEQHAIKEERRDEAASN